MKIMRSRHDIDLLTLIAWQGLFGSIPLIIVALLTATKPVEWSGTFIAVLLFNIGPANALTWVLWLYILHSLSTGTAGLSSLAVPVVGVVAAWIQLGERPGVLEAAGMGLIVIALAILTARELAASQTRFVEPAATEAAAGPGTVSVVAAGRPDGEACRPDRTVGAGGAAAPGTGPPTGRGHPCARAYVRRSRSPLLSPGSSNRR